MADTPQIIQFIGSALGCLFLLLAIYHSRMQRKAHARLLSECRKMQKQNERLLQMLKTGRPEQ